MSNDALNACLAFGFLLFVILCFIILLVAIDRADVETQRLNLEQAHRRALEQTCALLGGNSLRLETGGHYCLLPR
jgi:hypothetical protein